MSKNIPSKSGQFQPKMAFDMKQNSQTIDSGNSQNAETQLIMDEPGYDTLHQSNSDQEDFQIMNGNTSDVQFQARHPHTIVPPTANKTAGTGKYMLTDQRMQDDQEQTHASIAQTSNATTGYNYTKKNLSQRPKAFEQFQDSQDSIITSQEHSMIMNAAQYINHDKSSSIHALKNQHKKQLVKQFARKYQNQDSMVGNETQRLYHQSMDHPIDEQITLNTSRYGAIHQQQNYKRPYPGYAFPFQNIDSYTHSKKPSISQNLGNNLNYSQKDPYESIQNGQIQMNMQAFSPRNQQFKQSGFSTSKYEDTTRGGNSLIYNQSFGGDGSPESKPRYGQHKNNGYMNKPISSSKQEKYEVGQEMSSRFAPKQQNSLFASNQISEMESKLMDDSAIEKDQQNLPQIKFHILNNSANTAYSLKGQGRVFSQESKDRGYYKKGAQQMAQKLQELNSLQRPIPQTQGMKRRLMNLEFTQQNNLMQGSKDSAITAMTQRGARKLAPLQGSMDSNSSNENVIRIRKRSHNPVALQQAQKFKVNRRQIDYEYKPKHNEFTEGMMTFSGDNRFRERTNPNLAKFINGLQGNIKMDTTKRQETNQKAQKVFDMFKAEKRRYIKTLVQGETDGHCKGIKKRLDPTIKIQLKQDQRNYERKQQERLEKVQQEKKQRDKENTINKRMRVQDRINNINSHVTTRTKKEHEAGPNQFLNSFQNQLKSNFKPKTLKLNNLNSSPENSPSPNQNRDDGTRGDFGSPQSISNNRIVQFTLDNCDPTPKHIIEQQAENQNGEIELLVDGRQHNESPMLEVDIDDLIDTNEIKKDTLKIKPIRSENNGEDANRITTSLASKIGGAQKRKISNSGGSKANAILEALQLNKKSQITKSQRDTIDKKVLEDPEGPFSIIFQQFKADLKNQPAKKKESKNELNQPPESGPGSKAKKTKDILSTSDDLKIGVLHDNQRLDQDVNLQEFFRSMCQLDSGKQPKIPSIKHAVLNKEVFEKFLQDRYSPNIGKNIILFLESEYTSLFGATFGRFLSILVDFLNGGRESYKRMLFASLSLTNPGRICEHDIFTILEQFKQKESFFFYQDLITQKDVPRDYLTICDTSDQIFFDVFAQDLKTISQIINLQKRMMGITDTDTIQGIENDFAFKDYPGTKDQYEQDLIIQITYILGIIMKRKDAYWWSQLSLSKNQNDMGAFENMVEAKSLQEMRNRLCLLVAKHKLMEGGNAKRVGSSMSTFSDTSNKTTDRPSAQGKRNQSPGSKAKQLNFFRAPANIDPCLGQGTFFREGHKDKKISECIYITYNDFGKLFNARRALKKHTDGIPTLAVDFIKTCTLGLFDLRIFENVYSDCRELHGPKSPFQPKAGEVQAIKENVNKNVENSKKSNRKDTCNSKKLKTGDTNSKIMNKSGIKMQNFVQYQDPEDLFYQNDHLISQTDKFDKQEQRSGGGEFNIILSRMPNPKRQSRMNFDQDVKTEEDNDMDKNVVIISGDQVRELNSFKEHFGQKNFYNIFWCFYTLANVPADCENNIFALYMDEHSVKRGFKTVFGVEIEEVQLRFFNLFINPMDKQKMYKIDINRFYFVVQMICDCPENKNQGSVVHEISPCMQMAFRFYDYDNNGDIGSVDIQNILRYFDAVLVDEIQNNHYKLLQLKDELKNSDQYDEGREIRPARVIKKEIQKLQRLSEPQKVEQQDDYSHSSSSSFESSDSDDIIAANASNTQNEILINDVDKNPRQDNDSSLTKKSENDEEVSIRGSNQSKVSKSKQSSLREKDASEMKVNLMSTIQKAVFQQKRKIFKPLFDPYAMLSKEGLKILSNPLNEVMFEVRQLRNYFVEQAVIPSQKLSAAGQNFLNVKKFEFKFCAYLDKYEIGLSKPLPSQKPDEKSQFKMPAISNFFRQRFVCDQQDYLYGQALFIKLQEKQMASSGLQIKGQSSINIYLTQLASSNFDPRDLMIKDLGYGKEITEAFCEMASMLNKCCQVPKTISIATTATENQ